jgi:hypothetical protein
MKLQRSTLFLLMLALGLSSGIYLQQRFVAPQDAGEAAVVQQDREPLFSFEEAEITQVTIQRPDLTLSFKKRDSPKAGEPDWEMTAPEKGPASDGAVAYLLNLLATGDRQDSFQLTQEGQPQGNPQQRLKEFGLDRPLAQVSVTLADDSSHQLILGNSNFDNSGLYGVADGDLSRADVTVLLVTSDFEAAVQRPLAEWRYSAELPEELRENSPGEPPAAAPGEDSGAADAQGNVLDEGEDSGAVEAEGNVLGEGAAAGEEVPQSNLGDSAEPEAGEPPSPTVLPE